MTRVTITLDAEPEYLDRALFLIGDLVRGAVRKKGNSTVDLNLAPYPGGVKKHGRKYGHVTIAVHLDVGRHGTRLEGSTVAKAGAA